MCASVCMCVKHRTVSSPQTVLHQNLLILLYLLIFAYHGLTFIYMSCLLALMLVLFFLSVKEIWSHPFFFPLTINKLK